MELAKYNIKPVKSNDMKLRKVMIQNQKKSVDTASANSDNLGLAKSKK